MRMAEIYAVEYDRDPYEADLKTLFRGTSTVVQSGEKTIVLYKRSQKTLAATGPRWWRFSYARLRDAWFFFEHRRMLNHLHVLCLII